jgi:hypothetical protein
LGNYANKIRGEDRLFATSLAVNSLIDIWTDNKNSSDKSRQWIPGTSNSIKIIVAKGINHLKNNVFK